MKKIIITLLVAAMMLSIVACTGLEAGRSTGKSERNNTQEDIMNPSTDVAVIEKIFPKLEGIVSVEYEVKVLGSTDSSVPGPTDYRYQGYIVLSDDAAAKYTAEYQWNDSDDDVVFDTIVVRNGNYKSAPGFVNDIIKKSSYTGKAWMNGNTILFSVNTF